MTNTNESSKVPAEVLERVASAWKTLRRLASTFRYLGGVEMDDRYADDLLKAGQVAADVVFTFRTFAPRNGVDADAVLAEIA